MCTQIKLNHQIWAVILLSIVLMTPVICGRLILEETYEDREPYFPQREQRQRTYAALNTQNILMRRLQPPVKRLLRENTPLLVPCYFKLCPMGKRSTPNFWNN